MDKKMYVVSENGLLVLRQTRFAENLARGIEQPHDVCAYAHTLDEMHRMVDHLYPGDVDYSRVEKTG